MASSLESIEVTDAEWEEYKRNFNKSYEDAAEEKRRRQIYEATKQKVVEHNKKYEKGEVTFSMGINQFADLSKDEHRRYTGLRVDRKDKE